MMWWVGTNTTAFVTRKHSSSWSMVYQSNGTQFVSFTLLSKMIPWWLKHVLTCSSSGLICGNKKLHVLLSTCRISMVNIFVVYEKYGLSNEKSNTLKHWLFASRDYNGYCYYILNNRSPVFLCRILISDIHKLDY